MQNSEKSATKLALVLGLSIFGLLCFLWSMYILNFSQRTSGAIAIASWFLLGLPGLYSSVGECSLFISLPNFSASKFGRNVLLLLALSVLLAGPVQNILANAQKITKSISCISAHVNSDSGSKLISEGQIEKVESVLRYWRNNSFQIKENLQTAVSTMNALQSYTKEGSNSLTKYQKACNETIGSVTQLCSSKTGRVNIICNEQAERAFAWLSQIRELVPFLADTVFEGYCNVVGCAARNNDDFSANDLKLACKKLNLNQVCQKYANPKFCDPKETFTVVNQISSYAEKLNDMVNSFDSMLSFDLQKSDLETEENSGINKTAVIAVETATKNLGIIRIVVNLLTIVTSLSIFAMPIRSWIYIKKRLSAADFYRSNLFEKKEYHEMFSKNPRLWKAQELTTEASGSLILLTLSCLFAVALFLLDNSMCWVMKHSKQYGKFIVHEFAVTDVAIQVFGSGPLAAMIQSLLENVSTDDIETFFLQIFDCFPPPIMLEGHFSVTVAVLYGLTVPCTVAKNRAAGVVDRIYSSFYAKEVIV